MRARRWGRIVLLAGAVAALAGACAGEAPREEGGVEVEAAPVAAEQPRPAPQDEPIGTAPRREPQQTSGETAADRLEGVIALGGADRNRVVQLRPAEGRAVTLSGGLLPELSRLSGASVVVEGTLSGSGMMTRFAVARYEIAGIDGQRPVVGVLAQRGGVYHVGEGAGAVTLAAVPDALASNVGAKVWVTGVRDGSTLRVQSFGIIRAP